MLPYSSVVPTGIRSGSSGQWFPLKETYLLYHALNVAVRSFPLPPPRDGVDFPSSSVWPSL